MRHGSLFSGIGGFDLASEWMGWENVFHCEWNEFGQKVLKYYWPKSITYNDITKTDFSIHRGTIDILTGGFPCQPYSSAGKRLGKEDSRHLWPEMLRTIREIQPTWVVGENVRGLTNWNGGLVFDEVQAELEAQGYEVTPFLLPACAVNAPHRRDRIWFVAYSTSNDAKRIREFNNNKWQNNKEKRFGFWNEFTSNGSESIVAYSSSTSEGAKELRQIRRENAEISGEGSQTIYDATRPNGIEGTSSDSNGFGQPREKHREKESEWIAKNGEKSNASDSSSLGFCEHSSRKELFSKTFGTQLGMDKQNDSYSQNQGLEGMRREERRYSKLHRRQSRIENWESFPTVSPICNGDDGLSDRLDSITFPKWRNESIKAGGNAVVPQVVYQIFKAIEQYNQLNKQLTL
jgi:DNA (cytosine-5)-methyltransferase 1